MDLEQIANAALLVPALVLGVVAWRARRRGETELGLGVRGMGRDLLGGAVVGAIGIAATIGLLLVTGAYVLDGPVPDLRVALIGFAGIMIYFLVLVVVEEVVFRGFLMTGIGVVAGPWAGLVATAVLVALPYALASDSGPLAVLGEIVVNLVVGAARLRTGRIWFGVGLRMTWNAGWVLGAVADGGTVLAPPVIAAHAAGPRLLTGGGFGPEGGLIAMAVGVVMAAVLLARARRHDPLPAATR